MSDINENSVSYKIYREEMKDKDLYLYDKIFRYVNRYFKDTGVFIRTSELANVNNTSLAISARKSFYKKYLDIYLKDINLTGFYFFVKDTSTVVHDFLKGFARMYRLPCECRSYNLYEAMHKLSITSWAEEFLNTLSTTSPLTPSPDTEPSHDVWSSSAAVGYMYRGLSDPNYFFDHSSFFDVIETAIASDGAVEAIDGPGEKEYWDAAICNFFTSNEGKYVELAKEAIKAVPINMNTRPYYEAIVNNFTNRNALIFLAYTDFEYLKDLITVEAILPKIVEGFKPTGNDIKAVPDMMEFLKTMSDMMNVCKSELNFYTDEKIKEYNAQV